ncbi:hypothetical protein GGR56DRAFT_612546 [Xylariaceae sp. FL0804]|nr:hypothetical protein GGR56DRAFT_612546 [Xylariaceae sp. FL0804]
MDAVKDRRFRIHGSSGGLSQGSKLPFLSSASQNVHGPSASPGVLMKIWSESLRGIKYYYAVLRAPYCSAQPGLSDQSIHGQVGWLVVCRLTQSSAWSIDKRQFEFCRCEAKLQGQVASERRPLTNVLNHFTGGLAAWQHEPRWSLLGSVLGALGASVSLRACQSDPSWRLCFTPCCPWSRPSTSCLIESQPLDRGTWSDESRELALG